ncbi:sulfate ABC transporter permease subunit CysT [Stutzerimonas kirkiae]|uniref:Sulfate transport system permease protein CysT n=1 Tax=Stutzerimonas kirkiae TaxID=2211392 RepID=A0A4Q9RBL7_9GAMM|nr:sulfate ABC transporter permease subunit CysT [Stutzerimonas kirkiae]TBU98304.1 sulfate ABC transporter permease subunit CysT [Stutzerimonas kirkiae]TBV01940.1 sulfate ABC transporter permease subunit CysT [Stutzerimonas kirkiae]TBV06972.1 sulfate ABC transporter permease subunit CysT [Stutzerimonas kirkiae]TBV16240.1 sulfate ABC transporter permease subunit CysT [Stutzerimonas kirkiae]
MSRTPTFFLQYPLLPGFGLSFGFSVFYLSLVILLPLSALLLYVSDMSWAQYWQAISDPRVVQSYKVTLSGAFYSTIAAVLIGLLIAWIISRYDFPGRRLVDALVDLPFALPTSVAGLTLATLLVPGGWLGQWFDALGIKIAYAYPGILVAMVFTSLPFVVRTVQPVLESLGSEYEEAASILGANKLQSFFHVVLPSLAPALITGASQSFIRSLGEFGAVIMIAGNIPFKTEVSSLMIFVRLQEFNYPAAAAIASVILLASLSMLFGLQVLQGRIFKWQRQGR